ncbi:MAG: hypothetical protein RR420_08510 [Anaerovoracaceae bacterium]
MKKFYCVTTTVSNKGRITAEITEEIISIVRPDSTDESTKKCDIYKDWFATKKEAKAFIEETKEA